MMGNTNKKYNQYSISRMIRLLFSLIIGMIVMLVSYWISTSLRDSLIIGIVATITYLMIYMMSNHIFDRIHVFDQTPTVGQQNIVKQSQTDTDVPKSGTPKTPQYTVTDSMSRYNVINPNEYIPLNQNTNEYKLFTGRYSSIQVQAGYNESVLPSNQELLDTHLTKITSVPLQGGGGDDTKQTNDHVVHSGDIIELTSGTDTIQHLTGNSQLILTTPIPKFRTNLSKLRFEALDNHGSIKYGDLIRIKHTAVVDNIVQNKSIKYGNRVQSHQDGPTYDLFKLVDKQHPDSKDVVVYGDQFLIACGDQNGDKIYLKSESDKSISSSGTKNEAIVFSISQVESNSLCVCAGDSIFP